MTRTEELARLILPHLIRAAREGQIITYGDLGRCIGSHHRPLRYALGFIRDQLCIPKGLPMLNVLVVNKDTELPGESFLAGGTAHLSDQQYEVRFQEERARVFPHDGWENLLQSLGLKPINPSPDQLDEEAIGFIKYESRRGDGGESALHRDLKLYVARHPACLGLTPRAYWTEYPFPSGDECDVVFELDSHSSAVVEVKTGGEPRRLGERYISGNQVQGTHGGAQRPGARPWCQGLLSCLFHSPRYRRVRRIRFGCPG